MIVWLQLAVTIDSFTYVHLSCPICPLYFGSLTGKLSGTVLFLSRLLTSTAPVLDGIYMPYNYVGNVEQLLWRSTFMIILEWDTLKPQVCDPAWARPDFFPCIPVCSARESGSKAPQLGPVGYLFHLWQKRVLKCPPPCCIENYCT